MYELITLPSQTQMATAERDYVHEHERRHMYAKAEEKGMEIVDDAGPIQATLTFSNDSHANRQQTYVSHQQSMQNEE